MKVLVSAYACEPNKGSEPGVGWNWSRQIASFAETWVITRANNREIIEDELERNPDPNLHFVYADLPQWLRFWKKGRRGIHLYYYLWQFAALAKARQLIQEVHFDLAHQVTLVNDWMPSLLALLPLPLVWGPIGRNDPMPRAFLPSYSEYLQDWMKHQARSVVRVVDPAYRLTLQRSRKIVLISRRQMESFPFHRIPTNKLTLQSANAVSIPKEKSIHNQDEEILILSAGSLIPIKGFHLSLAAFAELKRAKGNVKLIISGDGPLAKSLNSIKVELGIESSVVFTGRLERHSILEMMQKSGMFLFPSFEGGGIVVLEAMAAGLPVVCLDYGGPGEMVTDECGIKVKPVNPEQTIIDLANALLKLASDPELRKRMGEAGRKRLEECYTWDRKREFIRRLYEEVLGSESSSPS